MIRLYLIKKNDHTGITHNISIDDVNNRLMDDDFRKAFADPMSAVKIMLGSKKDKSGDPVYQHAFRMAAAASLIGFSNRTIRVAIMHDLIEDTVDQKRTREYLKNSYG